MRSSGAVVSSGLARRALGTAAVTLVLVAIMSTPALATLGSISGTVSASGKPLVEGQADLYGETAGKFHLLSTTITGEKGEYQIPSLPEGNYLIKATGNGRNYVSEFYDGAASVELIGSAKPILVKESNVTGIDVQLPVGGQLEAKAYDIVSGAPVSGVTIKAVNESDEYALTQHTNEAGVAPLFSAMGTGDYAIEVHGFSSSSGSYEPATPATSVHVNAGSTELLEVPMLPLVSVSGKVTNASTGLPLTGITVSLYDGAGNLVNSKESLSGGIYVDNFFETKTTYRLGFSGGGYATQYYNAKSSLACAEPLSLASNTSTPNINAAMTTSAAGLGTCPSGSVPGSGGPGGGGGGGAGGGGGGPMAVTAALILHDLGGVLTPSGKAAKIGSILHGGGYVFSAFNAPEGGAATVSWFQVPAGAHVTRSRPRPVLVATATTRFAAAGQAKLKLKLTATGRKLLKHARHITLTAKAAFTPTGQAAVSTTARFTIRA